MEFPLNLRKQMQSYLKYGILPVKIIIYMQIYTYIYIYSNNNDVVSSNLVRKSAQ